MEYLSDPNLEEAINEILLENIVDFLRRQKMNVKLTDATTVKCVYIKPADIKTFHWIKTEKGQTLRVHEQQLEITL